MSGIFQLSCRTVQAKSLIGLSTSTQLGSTYPITPALANRSVDACRKTWTFAHQPYPRTSPQPQAAVHCSHSAKPGESNSNL